jgi:hypothetical protein
MFFRVVPNGREEQLLEYPEHCSRLFLVVFVKRTKATRCALQHTIDYVGLCEQSLSHKKRVHLSVLNDARVGTFVERFCFSHQSLV